MERPLEMLHELTDPVVVYARSHPQRTRPDPEAADRPALDAEVQRRSQQVVDNDLEGLPCAADLRSQAGGDIVVERQGGSHILMLMQ